MESENRKASFSSWPRKRPFFTRVLRHVLAQTQRIGQSELQKRDFINEQSQAEARRARAKEPEPQPEPELSLRAIADASPLKSDA